MKLSCYLSFASLITQPLLLLTALTGCFPYKISCQQAANLTEAASPLKNEALHHSLYCLIPRHRCQLHWYDVGHLCSWVLVGNDDDGIFGEEPTAEYRPKEKASLKKALLWTCRNPLHNFCFYVIGSANRQNSALTLLKINERGFCALHYEPIAKHVFASKNYGFLFALHGGKPFLSLRLSYSKNFCGEFYLGWRERGNFGIKLHPFKRKKAAR